MKKKKNFRIYFLKNQKKFLRRFAKTKKIHFRDLGNWFFEKAVEINYGGTFSKWKKSILTLSTQERTGVTLEFVNGTSKLQEINLSQSVLQQMEDKNHFEPLFQS